MNGSKEVKITQSKGFIVNIHDPINFDIDFDVEIERFFINAIKKNYQYISLNKVDILQDIEDNILKKELKKGKTFRCRLKGVTINRNFNRRELNMNSGKILQELRNLINSCDSWVTCDIYDIDIHNRLLINLKIEFDNKTVDIKDFILARSKVYSNIYTHYK